MSDFSFVQHGIDNTPQIQLPWSDIAIFRGDFYQNDFLETSMMISLFSDAPASTDELNRFNDDQLNKAHNRGWFGSTYTAGIEYGSKLWLLERERRNQETLNLAEQYCKESLKWLINDGIASEINVQCYWNYDVLVIVVEVIREFDENVVKQFSYVWANVLEGITMPHNHLWKRFSDDMPLGVYSNAMQPIDDVGYICNKGTIVKAYNAGATYKTETNPPFIRQCNDEETTWPPTDQAHLVGMPFKDFDNSPCASTEVNDFNWVKRQYGKYGYYGVITGGKYRIDVSDGTQSGTYLDPFVSIPAGSIEVDIDRLITSNFFNTVGLVVHIGSTAYSCRHVSAGGGLYRLGVTKDGATQWSIAASSTLSFTTKITWDGAFVRCYIDGVKRFEEANTGLSDLVAPTDVNPNNNVGAILADFSNFSFRDAPTGGNLVHRDLEGQSC